MRDDKALIESCLAGDQAAWNELVDRFGRLVYSIPRKIGMSAADADDVFQAVFGIVHRRLETLRDQTRLPAWIIRTTYRECWRAKKFYKSTPKLNDVSEPSDAELDDAVVKLETQHAVRQGLTMLDEKCRGLLEALFFTMPDAPYEEIAANLGMPIGSIGPTRARCFKKLETILLKLGA